MTRRAYSHDHTTCTRCWVSPTVTHTCITCHIRSEHRLHPGPVDSQVSLHCSSCGWDQLATYQYATDHATPVDHAQYEDARRLLY